MRGQVEVAPERKGRIEKLMNKLPNDQQKTLTKELGKALKL